MKVKRDTERKAPGTSQLEGTSSDVSHDRVMADETVPQKLFSNISQAKSFFDSIKRRLKQCIVEKKQFSALSLDEIRDWYRLGQIHQHSVQDTYEPDPYIVECCISEADKKHLKQAERNQENTIYLVNRHKEALWMEKRPNPELR